MKRPLLVLAASCAFGCLLGADIGARASLLLLGFAGAALALAGAAPARSAPWALGASALALGAAASGIEAAAWETAPLFGWASSHADEPVRLRGTATFPVPADGERHPLVLQIEARARGEGFEPMAGRARIEIGGDTAREDIHQGDRVEIVTSLGPARQTLSPGAFDVVAWTRREGLHALGYCKSPLLVRRGEGCGASPVVCLASRAREWARAVLRRHVLPGVQQGLVRAMVLGDRSGMDQVTAEAFRRAGTYHVLALSGAQVALVAGLLTLAARRLEVPPLPSAFFVSAALALYALLVGGDVPVLRAAVMGSVLVLGRGLDLDGDLANLLGAAALLLLAARPASVSDAGFLLSFGATLAILLIAPGLARTLRPLPLGLCGLLAGSVAAQVALLPLLASEFHRVSPAALVLNLAAVPLSGAVLILGALVLALAPLSGRLAQATGDLAWMAADLLLRTCDGGGLAAACDWRAPELALPVLVPWGWSLLALRRGGWGRGLVLACLTGVGLVMGAGPRADGRLELAVLDVGQGDALVLRSPHGRVMVVDAGPAREGRDLGERIVAPFLWSRGVRSLDRLLLTHAHPDHAGGVPFVIRAFSPREVWEGIAPRADPTYARFAAGLEGAGATRRSVARGVRAVWDGVTLEILGPRPGGRPPRQTRNDDSVVLLVRFGEVCFLLTGDVEVGGEGLLQAPPCDVLKVAHHGSRTSTSEGLLASVRPKLALVSAGFKSRFGHPHPDVLRRLARAGTLVLRTDRDGTIQVTTDGRRVWVAGGGRPPARLR